jgi:hypothetical protein
MDFGHKRTIKGFVLRREGHCVSKPSRLEAPGAGLLPRHRKTREFNGLDGADGRFPG